MDAGDLKKPLSTLELASSAVGLVKSLGIIFFMVVVEWARARQQMAENKAAVAEANAAAERKKGEIDAQNSGKPAADIVDEFLHGGDGGVVPKAASASDKAGPK